MLEKLNREKLEQKLINLPALEEGKGLQRDSLYEAVQQLKNNVQHVPDDQKSQFETLLPRLQHPALLLTQTECQLLLETTILTTKSDALQSISALIQALSELQEKQDDHSSTNHSEVHSALQTLITYYHDYLRQLCQSAAHSSERKILLEPPAQLIAERLGVYVLSQALARKLLCRNAQGQLVKENEYGNHAVVGYGGLHFKPNPVGREYIAPGEEFRIYALQALLGTQAVAPTMTIKIRHVVFQQTVLNLSFTAKAYFERAVQAGLTIKGVLLQDVLRAIAVIEDMQARLQDQCLSAIRDILQEEKGAHMQALYTRYPHYQSPNYVELNGQFIVEDFIGYIGSVHETEQILDFIMLLKINPIARLKEFEKYIRQKGDLLSVFGLIRHYPSLMYNRSLQQLLAIPSAFRLIKKLFPKKIKSTEDADLTNLIDAVLCLWKKFDGHNFSVLSLGSMLSNPMDYKADNYMVRIMRDENREVKQLQIVGIDNDKNFMPPIAGGGLHKKTVTVAGKSQEIEVQSEYKMLTKSILYCMPLMQEPLAKTVWKKLSEQSPEHLLAHWLIQLQQQNNRYADLLPFLTDGQSAKELNPNNQSMIEDASDYGFLDDGNVPIQLHPVTVSTLYRKLQRLFLAPKTLKLWELLERLEPLVGRYYQAVLRQPHYAQPLEAYTHIHNHKDSVESLLNNELTDPTRRGQILCALLRQAPTSLAVWQAQGMLTIEEATVQWVQQVDWVGLVTRKKLKVDQVIDLLNKLGEHFTLSLLSLSATTATVWLQIAAPKGLYFVTQLLLRSGADITCADEFQGWTVLHTLIRHLLELAHHEHAQSHLQLLTELLVQYPNAPINQRDKQGCTPLHYLYVTEATYSLVETVLKQLLNHGADLEATDKERQETRLERSMRRDDVLMFCLLANHGAGRKTDAKRLLEFIDKHRDHPLYCEKLACAEQRLAQQNSLLAWQLCLRRLIQTTLPTPTEIKQHCPEFPPKFNYAMEGAITGKCYLPPEVVKHLFNPDGTPKRTNQYGRRPVVYFKSQDIELQAKFYPEMPGVQEAVRLLSELLFCQGVAQSELFQLTDRQNRVYPVLFSQHVPGEDLQSLFDKPDEAKQKLDLLDRVSFTELLFLTLLVNPEDGKPDNYVLKTLGQHYCIVGIDEDHSFVEPVLMEQGQRVAQVKTIVYCLDQMQQPLDNKVCQAFAQMDAVGLLQKWLSMLQERQNCYETLFDERAREQLCNRGKFLFWQTNDQPTVIRIPFPPKSVVKIYEKMLQIQTAVYDGNITGLQLLKRAMPSLGLLYEKAFKEADTPLKRFHHIGATAYSIVIGQHYQTRTDSKMMLSSLQIPEKAMIALQNPYTPKKALEELMLAHHEELQLQAVVNAMQQGDFNTFQELFLDSNKEKIIYYFDFQYLTRMQQDTLIKILIADLSFLHLRIKNCQTLTDGQLTILLQKSPNLQSLRLVNCPNITGQGLNRLDEHCPSLQVLSLINLIKLQSLAGYQLIGSRPLILSELRYLRLKNCNKLGFRSLQAKQLHTLDLSGWQNLSDDQLAGLVRENPNLNYLQLRDCKSITYPLLKQGLPALASCSVKLLTYLSERMGGNIASTITRVDVLDDLKVIDSILKQNTALTEVDLGNLTLNEKVSILLAALGQNTHIAKVSLSENGLSKLLYPLESMNKTIVPNDLVKILLIGDSGTGKSCLLDRFTDNNYKEYNIATIGVNYKIMAVDCESMSYKLQIWDTAGIKRFNTITTSFYKGAHIILVCFDVTNRESFLNVEREWDKLIWQYANREVTVLLLGLKSDLTHKRVIDYEEGKKLADKLKMRGYYECSAKSATNIEKIFYEAVKAQTKDSPVIINKNLFSSYTFNLCNIERIVTSIRDKSFNPYLTDKQGNNVLHFVAEQGDVVLMNELLKLNIHVGIKNELGKTALDIATERKDQAMITAINNHINVGRSPYPKNLTFLSIKQSQGQSKSFHENRAGGPSLGY